MRQLEEDHLAEERRLLNGDAASAPTTPIGRVNFGSTVSVPDIQRTEREPPAPIGHGRETANGAKSMPASRRTSGYGGTFGLEKLSLSAMEPAGVKSWKDEEDEVDNEGAQSESRFLQ